MCLCDYQNGDRVRELACRHRFHADCIDPWFSLAKRKCPVCNQDAVEPRQIVLNLVRHRNLCPVQANGHHW
eukprot:jgi/Hompol1/5088/HPOL_000484-RA